MERLILIIIITTFLNTHCKSPPPRLPLLNPGSAFLNFPSDDLFGLYQKHSSVTAWIGSTQSALVFLLAILGGSWFDKYGPRPLMFFGTICSALGYLALSFVSPSLGVGCRFDLEGGLTDCACWFDAGGLVHAIMAFLFGSVGYDFYWNGSHVRLRCWSRRRVSFLERFEWSRRGCRAHLQILMTYVVGLMSGKDWLRGLLVSLEKYRTMPRPSGTG